MLNFDERGNLKPYQCIHSSLSEMENYFVSSIKSETRKNNFEKYLRYSSDLKRLSGGAELTQWINGSFVTMKAEPEDIDLVTFLRHDQVKKMGTLIDSFKMHNGLLIYGVDAYIVEVHPTSSKYFNHTIGNKAYWNMQFGNTKTNRLGRKHKKGFLEIIY